MTPLESAAAVMMAGMAGMAESADAAGCRNKTMIPRVKTLRYKEMTPLESAAAVRMAGMARMAESAAAAGIFHGTRRGYFTARGGIVGVAWGEVVGMAWLGWRGWDGVVGIVGMARVDGTGGWRGRVMAICEKQDFFRLGQQKK